MGVRMQVERFVIWGFLGKKDTASLQPQPLTDPRWDSVF